jgi:hypothetical protein
MKLSEEQKKNIVKTAIYGFGALTLYYMFKGDNVQTSIKKAIVTPADVVEAVVTEVTKTTKGKISKEEFLRRMNEGRNKSTSMSKKEHDSNNKKSYWKW